MRTPARAAVVAAALVLLLLAAGAAGASPARAASEIDGTYVGTAQGTSTDGKKASSGVTVWVEDLGEVIRFTFRIDKLPVIVDAQGPDQSPNPNAIGVPLSIDSMGVKGSAVIMLRPKGDGWILTGRGSGKALQYAGKGTISCTRISTGVALPALGEQVRDVIGSLFGAGPTSSRDLAAATAAGAAGSGDSSGADEGSAVAPGQDQGPPSGSVLDVAGADPPIPDLDKLGAVGLMILFLTMVLVLGIATPAELDARADTRALERDRRAWWEGNEGDGGAGASPQAPQAGDSQSPGEGS